MEMLFDILVPAHICPEEVASKLNIWLEKSDGPIREHIVQDYISSVWPLMWHLKVSCTFEILNRSVEVAESSTLPLKNSTISEVCAICHNGLTGGVELLKCSHAFHTMCIHRWLQNASTCPMCRAEL